MPSSYLLRAGSRSPGVYRTGPTPGDRLLREFEAIAFDRHAGRRMEVELGSAHEAHSLVHAHSGLHHIGRVKAQNAAAGAANPRIHSRISAPPTPRPRADGATASNLTSGQGMSSDSLCEIFMRRGG